MKKLLTCIIMLLVGNQLCGCYMYREQAKALVPNIDLDQTLEIAELELKENKMSSVLTYWAIRDQVFTVEQAKKASRLYFKYIKKVDSEDHKARGFSVWHFTWAVSNIYRLGDAAVKEVMNNARQDAAVRVKKLRKRAAQRHFHGEKMLMGDAHFLGHRYAKKHLVVPGNPQYLQSIDDYLERINEED